MRKVIQLAAHLTAQAQVAFNDNATKLMLIALAHKALAESQAQKTTSFLAALLVLPFILFSPIAGWLSDRFSKRQVMYWALLLQLLLISLLIFSFHLESIPFALLCFFLLGTQAAIFSPAKQGILKELVGSEKLGMVVGFLELFTIVAILSGGFCGGFFFDHYLNTSSPWQAAYKTSLILAGSCLFSFLIFQLVPHTTAQANTPFRASLLWEHFGQLKELWAKNSLKLSALGVAYFYTLGGFIYLTLVQFGVEINAGAKSGAATTTGIMLCFLGIGIIIGSLFAARVCRNKIELGLIPVGGFGIAFSLACLASSNPQSHTFYLNLISLGFTSTLFCVPLNAYLQDQASDDKRGSVIAAANLLINMGGIFAVFCQFWAAKYFSAPAQVYLLIIPSILVSFYVVYLLPESLLRLIILVVGKCIYKVKAVDPLNIPKSGGALIISNHTSYVDALVLQMACPRPIRFIAFDAFHKSIWLGWALRLLGVIPISPKRAREAIKDTVTALKNGELVCIFPEGQITRTGSLLKLSKGFETIARGAGVPVIPAYVDRLWGSIFSFSENKYLWKVPRTLPYPVTVAFGAGISSKIVNSMNARRALLDLGQSAFQHRKELSSNLGLECFLSLTRKPSKTLIVDRTQSRKTLSRGSFLALSILLSRIWKKNIDSKRVAIVLPPGIAGSVANLSLVLADKIPVNLNFTAGMQALESSIERAQISKIISASALKAKISEFPWEKLEFIDIAETLAKLSKPSILFFQFIILRIAISLLPARLLILLLGIKKSGDKAEAGLLFTSGSSGQPKAVVLSHRNIIGNIAQFASTGLSDAQDSILGCLPLFHSFGFTVTLWYPILRGIKLVTVPSPLEIKKIAQAIKEEQVTIILGTPTFFKAYPRKLEKEDLASVRVAMTGAEKLPSDLVQSFKEKFNLELLEGYGLTETAPVTAINIPDPAVPTRTAEEQAGNKLSSVGRLIPGMTARIVDHESGQELSLFEVGMLHLRGPNIFQEYLNEEEKTKAVINQGWFVTGDLARFDEDGFLYIEGRLSRFSKIAGEMVPHTTIENKIIECLGLQNMESPCVVVTSIADADKGEALVVLTTTEISQSDLRQKLSEMGLANLWIPKLIQKVENIPILGTGKIDLKTCQKIAQEFFSK